MCSGPLFRNPQNLALMREMVQPELTIVPVTFRDAFKFVERYHRHHKPACGMKFAIGVEARQVLVGVATVGRPVARYFDDGWTLEVNRSCTDGTQNVNSCLYGAAWRVTRELGYRRLITYTQDGEAGSSLKAAGFVLVKHLPARKGWRDSSVKMKKLRAKVSAGGVGRMLWMVERP